MNTWNTLRESYQQWVYNNTLATVKRQIQQVENPTSAVVISMEAARIANAILLDYLTSEVALEEPEIGSTYPTSQFTTIVQMTNFISGCQGAAEIIKLKVMKATCVMPSPPPAGDDGPRLNSRGLTWELVMTTGIRARMATMRMWMRRKKHHTPTMDQCRVCRTEVIVGDVEGYECQDADDANADEEE
jgi:hypothetical protein